MNQKLIGVYVFELKKKLIKLKIFGLKHCRLASFFSQLELFFGPRPKKSDAYNTGDKSATNLCNVLLFFTPTKKKKKKNYLLYLFDIYKRGNGSHKQEKGQIRGPTKVKILY